MKARNSSINRDEQKRSEQFNADASPTRTRDLASERPACRPLNQSDQTRATSRFNASIEAIVRARPRGSTHRSKRSFARDLVNQRIAKDASTRATSFVRSFANVRPRKAFRRVACEEQIKRITSARPRYIDVHRMPRSSCAFALSRPSLADLVRKLHIGLLVTARDRSSCANRTLRRFAK